MNLNCFNCDSISSTGCWCCKKPKPKRQFSDEFVREQCEYLELNNIGMDNRELQMLPKIEASQIERTKIIGIFFFSF